MLRSNIHTANMLCRLTFLKSHAYIGLQSEIPTRTEPPQNRSLGMGALTYPLKILLLL